MAKNSPAGNALVIVESPAKARTIKTFLGRNFTVEASIGHVRDLPEGKKELPEKYKSEPWGYLGVNVEDKFTPIYVVPPSKQKQVAKLKKLVKEADRLYLATDEDREGEAISWHLREVLNPKVPVYRLVFHEITKEAIQQALENPRDIDDGLVRAQETRRILDRLYGYDVSDLVWKKVRYGLSAGRVQSVAVRLIVERERERMAFVSASYWDLLGVFAKISNESFEAALVSVDGRKIPAGKDFDSKTGKLKDESLLRMDEAAANALAGRLRSAEFKIAGLESKEFMERPKPPFTTSTLQQEANRKLGFTARRTMSAAQSLYENGHITYMRTDSTNMAKVAVDAARDLVRSEYGPNFVPQAPPTYQTKVKNAQEAHEAIRPALHPELNGFEFPNALKGKLTTDEFRLFELIWKRTMASQMTPARKRRITIAIEGGGAVFQASGTSIEFEGFLRAYVEGSDDPEAELADKEKLLPKVVEGEQVNCRDITANGHSTQPPARYSEASLTRTLEEKGIGRPSTYASIIETIQSREYVFKKGNALIPTWVAFSVVRMLEEHLPSLVNYEFTAKMEDFLDAISRQEAGHLEYLNRFYFGDGDPGLKKQLEAKLSEIDARSMNCFAIGKPDSGEEVCVRVGRYGPFLEQGERRANLPDKLPPDELTLEKALELLDLGEKAEQPLGNCPETGRPIFLKQGRFGPYVQLGPGDTDEQPKNASLLKGMDASAIDVETALRLLSLPRTLGQHPTSAQPVEALNGRHGPYIKCGEESRSLPDGLSPLDVSLEQALELLAQPKTRGRRSAPKEPLNVFEKPSPVTGEPVKLLDGYYGPYVTDGTTNASLPKGLSPAELTFERALDMLAEKAAKGPSRRKKKTAKKKTTKKKTASSKKKTTRKK